LLSHPVFCVSSPCPSCSQAGYPAPVDSELFSGTG
jgi:hypothetical protein